MKKVFKISLTIFLSILMCFMAVPVMAAEVEPVAYGEAFQVYMPVHYRQDDPTWANVPMQSLGLSIGTHGCTLTSFTMIVNYYGFQENPAMVNSTLGAAACIFDYDTAASAYNLTKIRVHHDVVNDTTLTEWVAMDRIRTQLMSSRPVLVGFKKGSNTHFVVAYSYVDMEPGGTPVVSILDPSTTRNKTKLSQYYADGWEVHRLYAFY